MACYLGLCTWDRSKNNVNSHDSKYQQKGKTLKGPIKQSHPQLLAVELYNATCFTAS